MAQPWEDEGPRRRFNRESFLGAACAPHPLILPAAARPGPSFPHKGGRK
jgi:hypothetical protein